jgi:hypothetical protein
MIIIIIKPDVRKIFVADFADFVAGSTKPLDNQEVYSAHARCGRDSSRNFNCHIFSIIVEKSDILTTLDRFGETMHFRLPKTTLS